MKSGGWGANFRSFVRCMGHLKLKANAGALEELAAVDEIEVRDTHGVVAAGFVVCRKGYAFTISMTMRLNRRPSRAAALRISVTAGMS